ncbi:TIGR04222 domain-containing membrane protein [Streptomyces sp. NPDC097640]|uniref:TIGR04222 domain-containing membrane protein n=1 Tax=Streptomyces sp. NPDC097640 TaxID=3157229 RepID=UPI003327C49A
MVPSPVHGPPGGHTGGKGMDGVDGGIPVRTIFRRRESVAPLTLDIYDIAYLAGGPRRVARTALIQLRERGAIKFRRSGDGSPCTACFLRMSSTASPPLRTSACARPSGRRRRIGTSWAQAWFVWARRSKMPTKTTAS